MKKSFQIISLIGCLTLCFPVKAQKIFELDSRSILPNELFQRWKLDYGTVNGKKFDGLRESPFNDFEFKKNGEYLLYDSENTFVTGKWEYNSDDKTIQLKRLNGELKYRLVDINAASITVVLVEKSLKNTSMERLKLYYVPR